MGIQQNFPDLNSFAANIAAVLGKIEVIKQPLYDRILYPTAGIGALTFFSTPQGSGQSTESGVGANVAKSLADTNMTQQGQLPSPQAFWVDNIQVIVDPGSVAMANTFTTLSPVIFNATAAATVQAGITDVNTILNSGTLQLTVGQKPYFQLSPLAALPPQYRKRIDASASVTGTNAQPAVYGSQTLFSEGAPMIPVRKLDPGIGIPTGMNFSVTMTWPALNATPTNNARIACHMDGWLFRAAQ